VCHTRWGRGYGWSPHNRKTPWKGGGVPSTGLSTAADDAGLTPRRGCVAHRTLACLMTMAGKKACRAPLPSSRKASPRYLPFFEKPTTPRSTSRWHPITSPSPKASLQSVVHSTEPISHKLPFIPALQTESPSTRPCMHGTPPRPPPRTTPCDKRPVRAVSVGSSDEQGSQASAPTHMRISPPI
jgi:hypothetical protein